MKKSGISRRRFIEYTGAAGLGMGLSSVLPQISLAKTGIKVAAGAANPLGLAANTQAEGCLLYTSPSPRDGLLSRMPSSA